MVLAGMLRVILDEARHDAEFVDRFTRGVDALRDAVAAFPPAVVEARTGVSTVDLVEAARVFASGPRGCAVGGTGINMSPHPTLNEYLLLCLNTVCGRYRRAGERVTNPGALTAGRSLVEGPRGPRSITGRGDAQPRVRDLQSFYDQMPSAALADEILEPGEGQVRALIVSGGNPLVALPDTNKTARALASLDLLVSLDVRMAQTAAMSDYVIACPMSLEKADTTLASDLRFPVPFAQYTPAVVPPGAELVEEWDFFRRLAAAMGTPWDLSGRVGLPIPIDVPVRDDDRLVTSVELWEQLCGAGSVSFEELRAHPHGVLPDVPDVFVEAAVDSVRDEDRLELADPMMLDELQGIAASPVAEPAPEWPFLLTSRRMVEYYNSWGQDVPSARARHGANPAFMHPDDLAALGLVDGALARVDSEHGTIEAVVRAAPDVARATVSLAHCWGGAVDAEVRTAGSSVNLLVDNANPVSDEVGMARQSAIPVRVGPAVRGPDPSRR